VSRLLLRTQRVLDRLVDELLEEIEGPKLEGLPLLMFTVLKMMTATQEIYVDIDVPRVPGVTKV